MARTFFQDSMDFPVAVALGNVENVTPFSLNGNKVDAPNDVIIDVAAIATAVSPFIPLPSNNGESIEIVSDNVADIDVIEFEVLGPNGVLIPNIQITLTGTTPVVLPGLISRINTARSIGINGYEGTLTIKQAGAGTIIFALMGPLDQQLNQALRSTPAGFKMIIKSFISAIHKPFDGTSAESDVWILAKRFEQIKFRRVFPTGLQSQGGSVISLENFYPEGFTGAWDIKIQAKTSTSVADISARINGLLFGKS